MAATVHTIHPGRRVKAALTGEEALDRIFDVICEVLPRIPVEDPVHRILAKLTPHLGRNLGHPTAIAITNEVN